MASQAFSVHLSPNSHHFPDIIPIHIPMSSMFSDKLTSDSLSKKNKAAPSSSSSSPIDGDKLTSSVNSLLSSLGIFTPSSGNFQVAVDWKETSASHVIKVEVPGMKKEQVKIEMEDEGGHVLVISGEKKEKEKETQQESDKWIFAEVRSGKFCRRFKLPQNAKVDEIKATMEDGVLTVTVPKVEVSKKTAKSIQISAA